MWLREKPQKCWTARTNTSPLPCTMLGTGDPRAGSLFHKHRSAFSFRRLERMAASHPNLPIGPDGTGRVLVLGRIVLAPVAK